LFEMFALEEPPAQEEASFILVEGAWLEALVVA